MMTLAMESASAQAQVQAADPFDYPPKVRMPTHDEVNQVSRSVQ